MRSTAEWRKRSREDALFAVASHAGKEGRRWDVADFRRLGQTDWVDFEAHWRRYEPVLSGTCVEIGCGAGRMTAPLADTFDHVVGVDVSEDMLALARGAAPSAEFRLVDDTSIPMGDCEADAIFTCHVLQHFEQASDVAASLREAFRVLRPGGTIMAHLILLSRPDDVLRDAVRRTRLKIDRRWQPMHSHTQVRRYSNSEARGMFENAGFRDVELTEFRAHSDAGIHPFYFGRR